MSKCPAPKCKQSSLATDECGVSWVFLQCRCALAQGLPQKTAAEQLESSKGLRYNKHIRIHPPIHTWLLPGQIHSFQPIDVEETSPWSGKGALGIRLSLQHVPGKCAEGPARSCELHPQCNPLRKHKTSTKGTSKQLDANNKFPKINKILWAMQELSEPKGFFPHLYFNYFILSWGEVFKSKAQ